MITTWNSKCGVAEYTKMEVEATMQNVEYRIYPDYTSKITARDEPFVSKRVWGNITRGNMTELTRRLRNDSSDIVHFQFNYGFFKLSNLAAAIEQLHEEKRIVITFHKTEDGEINGQVVSLRDIAEQLNLCAALIVHQEKDKELLCSYGIEGKIIHVINHGQVVYPEISAKIAQKQQNISSGPIIGSYGFFLSHKGIKEVIQAVAILKDEFPRILYTPVCALYEGNVSVEYYNECVAEVERLGVQDNVKFITDFLPNAESMAHLQACDVLLMPYKPTKESASGAIRFCMAVNRPIITTRQPIFDEFKECTYQIEAAEKELIADAVKTLINDKTAADAYVEAINQYVKKTSWYATADKIYNLYRGLI